MGDAWVEWHGIMGVVDIQHSLDVELHPHGPGWHRP